MSVAAVVDVDRGWKAFLAPFVGQSPKVEMTVGSDVHYAIYLEYGHRTSTGSEVPARPYLRWTLDEHGDYQAEITRLAKHLLRLEGLGGGDVTLTLAANLQLLGNQIAKDLQRTIVGMGLIDTGRLYRSQRVLRIAAGGSTSLDNSVYASVGNQSTGAKWETPWA